VIIMRVEAVRFQTPKQARKRGSFLGVLSVMLACLTGMLPAASHAEAVGEVRYVWADTLLLRAAPEGREVARLPYGAKVVLLRDAAAPVPHRETLATLRGGSEHQQADIVLDGHWRRAQALGKEGWVFDGYLSRYPAPGGKTAPSPYDDEEIAYAAQVFGVAHAWRWKNGDAARGAAYQVMRRKWTLDENPDAAEVYWTRVEFKQGGAAELGRIVGNGSSENLALEGMPLTFNEALLWWRHFNFFEGSGTVDAGRRVEAGPPDDDTSGLGYDRIIKCGKATCDILRDVVD
jgi:hypothetical protein